MATIYRCDRCGCESNNKFDILEIPGISYSTYGSVVVDLCKNCLWKIHEFIRTKLIGET